MNFTTQYHTVVTTKVKYRLLCVSPHRGWSLLPCLLQGDQDEDVLYEDFDDEATMRELEALG